MLNQLQLLGIKLFSVSPSEMCDERTASKLANFNSAKRNGLSAQNLKYMAQLHDWWTYGLNALTDTHTANLHLPAAQTTSEAVRLPAPTLNDLLNPVTAASENEETSFIFDDPYGAKSLSNESDSDDVDNSDNNDSGPTATWAFDVERLYIDQYYMDFSNEKLIARFVEHTAHPAFSTAKSTKGNASSSVPAVSTDFEDEDWAAGLTSW
jgi:hypothetical protein